MIVIATLWILSIISLFTLSTSREARLEVKLAGRTLHAAEIDAIADAWIARAQFTLLADGDWRIDTHAEPWSGNLLLDDGPAPRTRLVRPDGIDPVTGAILWTRATGLTDEESRLPLRVLLDAERSAPVSGSSPLLAGLTARLRAARDTAYGDTSSPASVSMTELQALLRDLAPDPGAGLEAIDLLERLSGMGDGSVNVNRASAAVLAGLGLDAPLIAKIERFRNEGNTFESTDALLHDLTRATPLRPDEIRTLQRLVADGLLSTRSSHFSFIAEIELENGSRTYRHVVLERREPDAIGIVAVDTLPSRWF